MANTRDITFAGRTTRIILGATIASCLVAAVAAAPSAPTGLKDHAAPVKAAVSLNDGAIRPLAPGQGIQVSRAYDESDEDCTLILTPKTDAKGKTRYLRSVSCEN